MSFFVTSAPISPAGLIKEEVATKADTAAVAVVVVFRSPFMVKILFVNQIIPPCSYIIRGIESRILVTIKYNFKLVFKLSFTLMMLKCLLMTRLMFKPLFENFLTLSYGLLTIAHESALKNIIDLPLRYY
jgi:hypothetical protein